MRLLTYTDKNTAIHRLNPVVKLLWGITIVVLALLFSHPLYVLLLLAAVLLLLKLADVWREGLTILKLGIWLGISIIIINALVSYHGSHILAEAPFTLPVLGQPVITLEAIVYGAVMALKLLAIIAAFAFVNLTVHPDDVMALLLKLNLPYKSVLVTSLATRFIPCLLEDMKRINDAYRTRGVPLDRGNWVRRLKKRAGTIIPLLYNSLDRAVQVAEAMESRAFGKGKRTFYRTIRLSGLDWGILFSGLIALGAGIAMRVYDYGSYTFYPDLQPIDFSGLFVVMLAILAVIVLSIVPLAYLQRRLAFD